MGSKQARPFSSKGYQDEDILFFSWDTETAGLGGELLLITACDYSGTHVFKGENMLDEFIALLQNNPYPAVWFAHVSQYDWRYLMDYLIDHQIKCDIRMRTDTDFYQITLWLDGAMVVMRDSAALYPGKLADFAKQFTPELPKLEIDIKHFDPENPKHIEYAKRDAEILRVGMPRFDAMIRKHFGVGLGHTTAGTAIKAWQATLPEKTFYACSPWGEREEFIREGYFGGLVFLTRTDSLYNEGKVVAETYDINSSYPDKMRRYGVPWGSMVRTTDYLNGCLGIYRVRVRSPDYLVVPILPHRNARGHMAWNRGEFETVVTSEELIFAARYGYEILDVMEGYAFEDRIFPFSDFVDKCEAMRNQYKGRTEETLAKLIQNSSYGRFCAKRLRKVVFVPDSDNECIDAVPLGERGYFWVREEFNETMRVIPQWGVFITAYARLQLLSQIYKVGVENVYYGDTDSITVRPGLGHLFDVGREYGQYKLEKEWVRFRAIAPKVYSGQIKGGQWLGAAKGMPRKVMEATHWKQLYKGDKINLSYESLPSLRVAMQRGITPAEWRNRDSTDIQNSANWELHGNNVYPKMAV